MSEELISRVLKHCIHLHKVCMLHCTKSVTIHVCVGLVGVAGQLMLHCTDEDKIHIGLNSS